MIASKYLKTEGTTSKLKAEGETVMETFDKLQKIMTNTNMKIFTEQRQTKKKCTK